MIISDRPEHKIDAEFKTDGFLHITTFHKSDPSATEWKVKVIGLSQQVQAKLVDLIFARQRVLNESQTKDQSSDTKL